MRRCFVFLCLIALVGCSSKSTPPVHQLIGRDPTWFPLQLGANSINLVAFSSAMVQEIGQVEHTNLQIVNIDWVELMQNLNEEKVGAVFTTMNPMLIAQEKYTFSDPLILLGPALVAPSSSQATSLADFQCKIVGVYQFDDSVTIAEKYPTIIISLYQNMPDALEKLKRGEYDAVLMPILDAKSLIDNLHAHDLKLVTGPLNQKGLRLITLKDQNTSLIRHFNSGLSQLQKNGTYAQLRNTFNLN